MAQFFDNLACAVEWLYVNGWRQDESGRWLRRSSQKPTAVLREAVINRSPVKGDAVVCVVTKLVGG